MPHPIDLLHESVTWPGDGRLMRRAATRLLVDAEPVSRAAYRTFLQASGWRAPPDVPVAPDHAPMVCVSLEDARAYARWAKKRLPLHEDWVLAMTALGFDALGGGQVWEWTASRKNGGYVVRGGRYRNLVTVAAAWSNESWDDAPADDIGFRCVAEG